MIIKINKHEESIFDILKGYTFVHGGQKEEGSNY